ncbi:MAG: hypothetical protein Q4A34_01905 [Candidatus Saccharibacteria bacterium]|nr:hypothetical protein [Candidatus Saccharibacteria bacterium]
MRFTYPGHTRHARAHGFTLVEVLAVSPLIILVIIGVIASIVAMTRASAITTARTQLQADVLAVLDMMEQDIKFSRVIDNTPGNALHIDNFATSDNPMSPNRQLIRRKGHPAGECTTAATGVKARDALIYRTKYNIRDGALYRRIDLHQGCHDSGDAWQLPLHGKDVKLLDLTAGSKVTVEKKVSHKTIHVTLLAKRTVAGQEISYEGQIYVKSLNAGVGG